MPIGIAYLSGYIILLGIGTFIQKFSMKQLSPFQLEFLMAIGMFVVSVPALFLTQKSLAVPLKGLPIGAVVGILFSLGSLLFTLSLNKMPAGLASSLSIGYIIITAVLSAIFLGESFSLIKIIGTALTLVGVALLYWQH